MNHKEILKEIENLTDEDKEKYFDKFLNMKDNIVKKFNQQSTTFTTVVLIFYSLKVSVLESIGFGGFKINTSQLPIIYLFILPIYLTIFHRLTNTVILKMKLELLLERFYPDKPGLTYVLSKSEGGSFNKKRKKEITKSSGFPEHYKNIKPLVIKIFSYTFYSLFVIFRAIFGIFALILLLAMILIILFFPVIVLVDIFKVVLQHNDFNYLVILIYLYCCFMLVLVYTRIKDLWYVAYKTNKYKIV